MSVVRVDLGGGNFADLEPDRYQVDRELLADLTAPELSRDERRLLVALRSGPLFAGVLDLVLGAEAVPWRRTARALQERELVAFYSTPGGGGWTLTVAGRAAIATDNHQPKGVRP